MTVYSCTAPVRAALQALNAELVALAVSTAAHEAVGREDWIAGCVRLRLTGVQPRHSGGVEERDRLPLRGMESQSRGIRELRRCGRCEGCRAAAARPCRGGRRGGACAKVG